MTFSYTQIIYISAIRNLDGKLSASLPECLNIWSIYCAKLYEKPTLNVFDFNPVNDNDLDLDRPITY